MSETLLVWIIGFDDRKNSQHLAHPQLLGHTKSYTKVVIDQDTLPEDQPAAALLGKVIEIRVTETHKWHITGTVTNLNPVIPHIKDNLRYFEECEEERRRRKKREEEGEERGERGEVREEIVKVPITMGQVVKQIAGMAALSVGVFLTLRGIFGGGENISEIINKA